MFYSNSQKEWHLKWNLQVRLWLHVFILSYAYKLLNPSQITRRLIFLTPSLTTRLICINFLNKISGQTWSQKSQTSYNLRWREYILHRWLCSSYIYFARKILISYYLKCAVFPHNSNVLTLFQ
jgi:hypothetical protein